MFKRIRKQMTTKQILQIVYLLKKTKKLLIVVTVITMLSTYVPWQIIKGQTTEENTSISLLLNEEIANTQEDTSENYESIDVDSSLVIEDNHYEAELQKMRDVFNSHYKVECESKESRQQFKYNNDLRDIYDEMCKVENDDRAQLEFKDDLYINENANLISSFVEYDLEKDLFFIDLISKLESITLLEENREILELTKFYFENDFSVSSSIVDKAIEIVYSKDYQMVMKSTTYGNWIEYSRRVNYAKQWVSDKLRNVDKIYEKRTVIELSDWTYNGYTSCKTIKPLDTYFTKYEKKENCGFLGIGNIYNIYTRTSSTTTEYRMTYELKAGLFDETVDKMPSMSENIEGLEKFHLTKTLFYDYVLVPYHGDHEYFEVDLYFNNYYYNAQEDNFITSKSFGAKAGTSEQTLKYRGKITGNYRGSRYAYTYTDFEYRDGRVDSCSYSSCFTSSYLDGLEDMYFEPFSFTTAEEVFHTLISNFLFYESSLGDLYVPTNDYPYSQYGGYVEYSSTWIEYLSMLNIFAQRKLQDGSIKVYEHYFRNRLQDGHFPDDLDDFVTLNDSIIPSQRWDVYDIEDAIYHMNDFDRSQGGVISESEKGAYNIKIGSYNGYFELVYSTYYGTALTEEVDWINMGTYNYNKSSSILHFDLDMTPYKKFGNCGRDEAEGVFSLITDGWSTLLQNHPNYISYQNNQNAIDEYNYYKNMID